MNIKQMNFRVLLFFLILYSAFLPSCLPKQEKNETDKFDTELKSFNKSINQIGKTLDMVDAMQAEVDKVEHQRALGEISDVEADRLLVQIKETYGRTLARGSNMNPASSLPSWARQLNLTEPEGMKLDADYSQLTSAENPEEGFNSVMLVYTGDYLLAMKEAARIAKIAGIPPGKDYLQAVELSKTYDTDPIKGVAYMNFDPFVKDNDFNISITVDETGMLTISAVDVRQMQRQFAPKNQSSTD